MGKFFISAWGDFRINQLQVGLTATPVEFIDRNTFRLFETEDGNPTYNYTLEEAVNQIYEIMQFYEQIGERVA